MIDIKPYTDRVMLNKPVSKMNEDEKAYFDMQVEKKTKEFLDRYEGQEQLLNAIVVNVAHEVLHKQSKQGNNL